jgi:hypothetical protein
MNEYLELAQLVLFAGLAIAGIVIGLQKMGLLKINGSKGNGLGVMMEKLRNLEKTQDKLATAMLQQTLILEGQKNNTKKLADLQEKILDKLDDIHGQVKSKVTADRV